MDDVRQTSAFVAAAEELHLGRAGARLGVHPATVASRLRALESHLGLVLVDRSHRCRIALTQAGAALLPAARRAVAAMAALKAQSTEVVEGTRGVIRVALTGDQDARTEALVAELRQVDPRWEVSVERMSVQAAGRALAVGAVECSVGIGRLAPATDPGPFDPRPDRRESARVSRIRTAPRDAAAPSGTPPPLIEQRLVVAWRARWERGDVPVPPGRRHVVASPADPPDPPDPPDPEDRSRQEDERWVPSPSAHAARLVALVRELRFLAGGRRAAAALARRRAVGERRRAVEAERRLIVEETARYGFAEAAARAAERKRAEVLRSIAEAHARGEPLSPQLLVEWLCLNRRDEGDDGPLQE